MADGTRKRIEDIEVGDKVLATDPETGETRAEPVTAIMTSAESKHLVQISLSTGDASSTMIATEGHPFWAPALKQWVNATDLEPGMWLRTSAGTYVQVKAIKQWTAVQRVHNIAVGDLHTYYVMAGGAPVLVHNSGPGCDVDALLSKVDVKNLTMTDTVANHAGIPITKKGDKYGLPTRPFMGRNDKLLLGEIMAGSKPKLDPRGAEGALRWDTPGAMNGSEGTWELVIDTNQNKILHWNFVK